MIQNYSNQFKVNLNAYSGPLDVLLDLAKSQKVNLEKISITKLADQFHDFITSDKNLNLEIASEYLLIATWLTYLKSKLLLPESDDEEFKAIYLVGLDIKSDITKSKTAILIYNSEYGLTLYELLKSYSSTVMKREFQRINIPKLPVLTTEDGIKRIKEYFGKLIDWRKLNDLLPDNFSLTDLALKWILMHDEVSVVIPGATNKS